MGKNEIQEKVKVAFMFKLVKHSRAYVSFERNARKYEEENSYWTSKLDYPG